MDKKSETPELDIPYQIDYRNVKYPRLEFKTGNLLLVLPNNYRKEEEIIEKKKKWIYNKNFIIKTALETAKNKELNKTRTIEDLKQFVYSIAKNFVDGFDFRINDIYFRRMKTKWASYSSRGNVTINTLLKHLPQELIKYVIFHELAHSKERRHNGRFWGIISRKFEDYETKEKDLLTYWFLIQKLIHSTPCTENVRGHYITEV